MLGRVLVPLSRPAGHVLAPRLVAPASLHQWRRYTTPGQSHQLASKISSSPGQNVLGGHAKPYSTGQNSKPPSESPATDSQNSAPTHEDVASNLKHTKPLTESANDTEGKQQEEIDAFGEAKTDSETSPEGKTGHQPLPDLTQGIPSTLDAELQQARSRHFDGKSLNITEDPSESPPPAGGPGGPGDGLPKTEYVSSSDRKRQQNLRYFYTALVAALGGLTVYYGRNWETAAEEKRHSDDAPSGWSLPLFYKRLKARFSDTMSFYNEPAFPKLLPDPDPDPALQPPFTLVLSLEDLLMYSEWTREHGWRIAKRPGVDYFIRYLSQYYELVVWTSQPMMIADPVIRKLDPFRILRWPLFREATLYKGCDHVKVFNDDSTIR